MINPLVDIVGLRAFENDNIPRPIEMKLIDWHLRQPAFFYFLNLAIS